MKKESEEQMHLLGDEQQVEPVHVHIYFDLKDKPKEFMSALKKLDVSWELSQIDWDVVITVIKINCRRRCKLI